jgi:hypothetical protein
MGLRLTHVTNYRLVRHAGDDVEVALDVSQTASRQPWSMNEVLGDVEFTLASLHTTGSATRRGDLGHLVPAAFDHAEKSRLGFEVAEAPGVEVTLVIDSTTQVRRDSDARGIRPR